jgi:AraC-like DNA-binding protein
MTYPRQSGHPSKVWQYGRRSDGIEQAVWRGSFSLPLACHFHPEIQITAVVSGRRCFLTRNGALVVSASETLIVPPGLPHQPLGIETDRTSSLILYLPSAGAVIFRNDAVVVRTPGWFRADMWIDNVAIRNLAREELATENLALAEWANGLLMRPGAGEFERASEAVAAVMSSEQFGIGDMASARGMSREGFIRWFHRNVGMTPHAYRLVRRLNRARALLASDAAPAEAAAEAGFADQSHMGRGFRLAFGATPAGYRCAVRA